MLSKEGAINRVSEKLKQMSSSADPFVIIDEKTVERPFGWVFFYNSKRFLETGMTKYRLAGNGPVIVNKADETIKFFGSTTPPDTIVSEYERSISIQSFKKT